MIAFIDETGDVGFSDRSSKYLIVTGVVCADIRYLHQVATRARQTLRRKQKLVAELKGSSLPAAFTRRMLIDLAAQDVAIYIAVWDKKTLPRLGEGIYVRTLTACVGQMVSHYSTISIIVDQRYNAVSQQMKLIRSVRSMTGVQDLDIRTETSHNEKGLQVADAVAWSLHQKYEYDDCDLYEQIAGRIRTEFSVTIKKAGSTWGV